METPWFLCEGSTCHEKAKLDLFVPKVWISLCVHAQHDYKWFPKEKVAIGHQCTLLIFHLNDKKSKLNCNYEESEWLLSHMQHLVSVCLRARNKASNSLWLDDHTTWTCITANNVKVYQSWEQEEVICYHPVHLRFKSTRKIGSSYNTSLNGRGFTNDATLHYLLFTCLARVKISWIEPTLFGGGPNKLKSLHSFRRGSK